MNIAFFVPEEVNREEIWSGRAKHAEIEWLGRGGGEFCTERYSADWCSIARGASREWGSCGGEIVQQFRRVTMQEGARGALEALPQLPELAGDLCKVMCKFTVLLFAVAAQVETAGTPPFCNYGFAAIRHGANGESAATAFRHGDGLRSFTRVSAATRVGGREKTTTTATIVDSCGATDTETVGTQARRQ